MSIKTRVRSQYTEDELLEMTRREITEPLNDREIAFCEYYVHDNNVKLASLKAGYQLHGGTNYGVRYRQSVVDYIAWLKLRTLQAAFVNATDILNSYAKMAFYDITDYVEIKGNKVRLKDSDQIDGQIVQEISINNTGSITVKFPDRLKAFERLEGFMTENPYDWKRKLEEEKLDIMREKVEIEKTKMGYEETLESDGFIEALENVAANLYDDEKEENEEE